MKNNRGNSKPIRPHSRIPVSSSSSGAVCFIEISRPLASATPDRSARSLIVRRQPGAIPTTRRNSWVQHTLESNEISPLNEYTDVLLAHAACANLFEGFALGQSLRIYRHCWAQSQFIASRQTLRTRYPSHDLFKNSHLPIKYGFLFENICKRRGRHGSSSNNHDSPLSHKIRASWMSPDSS